MKYLYLKVTLLIMTFIFPLAQAKEENEIITTSRFSDLNEIIKKLDPKHTLLVMDDDDTLNMIKCTDTQCQYLGGPAWYSWQKSLLTKESPYRVAATENDLSKITTLLLSINYMTYPESDIPNVLESLSKSGVKLLVETARGPSHLSATENQFNHLQLAQGSNHKNLLDLINKNALIGKKSKITSLASPFIPCGKDAPQGAYAVSYQQGVMYAAGQNKGMILNCLLKSTESSGIKNIVFIDDTLVNVQHVYNQFKGSELNVKAIHYTALAEHKKALTVGRNKMQYQDVAWARWEAIKTILDVELIDSAIPVYNNILISEEN
jgi:hypothetical protein